MDPIVLSLSLPELPTAEYLDELFRKLLVTAGDPCGICEAARRLNLNIYVHS